MSRHSIPDFPPNNRGFMYWVVEVNATLCLNPRAKKWKYDFKINISFPPVGIKPQPVAFTVTVCGPAPRLASISYLDNKKVISYFLLCAVCCICKATSGAIGATEVIKSNVSTHGNFNSNSLSFAFKSATLLVYFFSTFSISSLRPGCNNPFANASCN